ncbi:hypothetical protein GobsT_44160 [Gemmata obscuriglobus]|uniref:hypothetical protein n=1 Tax=Gemmata obscuriglobus TaxID=114 RepID=UPI00016C4E6F|nr:hypothetical protein [Gemmata obscuriglobus]QEG29618.1 hypothetical protein GobsT_44160 [Gemmata obscuriglobus]VTS08917.1 unnamed protein product [Gemmata obscuriglobus UQM 2246]
MRVPLIRFGQDNRPLAWWECFFFPIVMPAVFLLLGAAALASIPYFAVFPDHHAHEYDFGTERQQEVMRRYRQFASRVPVWRRVGRALAFPLRQARRRRTRRCT